MADTEYVEPADELSAGVRETIHDLLVIKGRLPLLKAITEELRAVGAGAERRVRNDAVLQIVRDSFDMLVIDLASLREGMTAPRGTLNLLKDHLQRFRLFTRADIAPAKGVWCGGRPTPEEEAFLDQAFRDTVSRQLNEVVVRLFPRGVPVTEPDVQDLICRFRADTEPTDRDRNRVRAHRYEPAAENGAKYAQTILQVESQIGVFEGYLRDLYLVLTKASYMMNPLVFANAKRTAEDLADLIIWGSINTAVIEYGVVKNTRAEPPPWYHFHRSQFFTAAGASADSSRAT